LLLLVELMTMTEEVLDSELLILVACKEELQRELMIETHSKL
jgi:hypothetical protein